MATETEDAFAEMATEPAISTARRQRTLVNSWSTSGLYWRAPQQYFIVVTLPRKQFELAATPTGTAQLTAHAIERAVIAEALHALQDSDRRPTEAMTCMEASLLPHELSEAEAETVRQMRLAPLPPLDDVAPLPIRRNRQRR